MALCCVRASSTIGYWRVGNADKRKDYARVAERSTMWWRSEANYALESNSLNTVALVLASDLYAKN